MSRQPPPRSAAIVKGSTIDEIARHTVRWTSLGLLVVSFVGAIVAINGAWPNPWYDVRQISLIAAIGGFVLQGFCTLMEWANRKRRLSPKYLGPLVLDLGSTYIGFAPLLAPIFVGGLVRAGLGDTLAAIIAHAGVILLAIWLAYYPEQNLVDG
jgi:hypothetical protein